jgi:GntR family transcriptional regulator
MLLTVDPGAPQPLFEQLVASIRNAILAGSVASGERLPTARDLAQSLDINLHTVLRAYQVLRDEGFIELRRGRGAVVTERTRDYEQLMADISRLVIEAKRLELTPSALSDLIREAWT